MISEGKSLTHVKFNKSQRTFPLFGMILLRNTDLYDVYVVNHNINVTSRDRPKSAPYPRLKNSKKDFQVSIYSTRKSKNQKTVWTEWRAGPANASPWRAKRGGALPKLSTFLSQLKGDPLAKKQIFEKSLKAEKLEGGPLGFFNIHSVAKQQKIEEGPFGLARYGMYAGKQEKPFWFSSLGQMVQ